MADFIDRKALLKKLCDEDPSHMEDYYYNAIADFPAATDVISKDTYEAWLKSVKALAEADVVPVVRCKDCKHRYKDEEWRMRCHKKLFFECNNDDYFCRLGERKVENG